jgi:NAD-dependent dihydropyrimidine dehydrogenase PreA subunit
MYGPPKAFHGYRHSITIDVDLCSGCFRCAESCQVKERRVIGRALINGRRKAYVRHPELCVGCYRCLKACLNGAIRCVKEPKPGG